MSIQCASTFWYKVQSAVQRTIHQGTGSRDGPRHFPDKARARRSPPSTQLGRHPFQRTPTGLRNKEADADKYFRILDHYNDKRNQHIRSTTHTKHTSKSRLAVTVSLCRPACVLGARHRLAGARPSCARHPADGPAKARSTGANRPVYRVGRTLHTVACATPFIGRGTEPQQLAGVAIVAAARGGHACCVHDDGRIDWAALPGTFKPMSVTGPRRRLVSPQIGIALLTGAAHPLRDSKSFLEANRAQREGPALAATAQRFADRIELASGVPGAPSVALSALAGRMW